MIKGILKIVKVKNSWGLYYKTIDGNNFSCFVISWSVSQCQTFPHQSNICSRGWSFPEQSLLQDSTLMVGSQTFPQYLTSVEVTNSGNHSSLLRYGTCYCRKKLYSTGYGQELHITVVFPQDFGLKLNFGKNS